MSYTEWEIKQERAYLAKEQERIEREERCEHCDYFGIIDEIEESKGCTMGLDMWECEE